MDRNTIIGMILLFGLFMAWQQYISPSPAELEAEQRRQDSLARVEQLALQTPTEQAQQALDNPQTLPSTDSLQLSNDFGPFAGAATGQEQEFVLDNEFLKLTFSNKGGRITAAELHKYQKVDEDELKNEVKSPLLLLEDKKNTFSYTIPVRNTSGGYVRTSDLYFAGEQKGNSIVFRADVGPNQYVEQTYTLGKDYAVDYDLRMVGLQNIVDGGADNIQLDWVNYLDKLEKNTDFERRYSTVYFKPTDESSDYCNCTKDDTEDVSDERVKWVSNSNQFFSSALLADESFSGAVLKTEMLDDDSPDLKKLISTIQLPYGHSPDESVGMTFYIGPNEFERLHELGVNLEDVIPFGQSIFGTINRWIIRPLFNFLSQFIGSKGIVILILTFLVKLAVYPLMYRMLYSQSKMAALKPEMEKLKAKLKDKPQEQQQASMKMYSEYGVNPLGGCLPMVLQMPIWFALYRFFPASIQFRQEPFLWATDLSSYDVFFRLPVELPLGFGDHVSLFTLLWAVTTLIYTYYNTKNMDMSANPAMKYVQYIMPLFFLGFFNSYASGLTCYLLFSNMFNIAQTIITKEYIIDKDKVRAELQKNKEKPRKKGGFRDRLQSALEEQQKLQAEREKKTNKKGKKPKK